MEVVPTQGIAGVGAIGEYDVRTLGSLDELPRCAHDRQQTFHAGAEPTTDLIQLPAATDQWLGAAR